MEQVRYIENPFLKIFNIVNADRTQLYSLLLKLLRQFFHDVPLPSLTSIKSKPQKSEEDISAYAGTAGYLIMLLRLHTYFTKPSQNQSDIFASKSHIVGDEHVSQLTDPLFYIKMAQQQYTLLADHIDSKKKDNRCFSYFCSEVSVWVSGMHLGFLTKDLTLFRRNQQRMYLAFESLKKNLNKNYWELLYGVPGFLYAVLELQKHYDRNENEFFRTNFSPMSVELTHLIIREGIKNYQELSKTKVDLQKLHPDFRLVYYFGKTQYLGGAHGLGGNLNILLTSMALNDFKAETVHMMLIVKSSIQFLLRHLIKGNFSTRSGSHTVKLVHFCHGAPGIVTPLCKFADMFQEMGIQLGLKQVIETNLNHIWKYGVLRKGFGLCHGISGNAYAFISPSLQSVFHERVEEFRKKAQLLALLLEQEGVMKEISEFNFEDRMVVGRSDEPYSLMLGIAGDICFTMDVMDGTGHFPGYDL